MARFFNSLLLVITLLAFSAFALKISAQQEHLNTLETVNTDLKSVVQSLSNHITSSDLSDHKQSQEFEAEIALLRSQLLDQSKNSLDNKISKVLLDNKGKVVYISVAPKSNMFGETGGIGTGFFIEVNDEFAYVVTNHHVVARAHDQPKRFKVEIDDIYHSWSFPAEIVGVDKIMDIAVLKVERLVGNEPWKAFTWAEHSAVREGDPVVVIGHGMGLAWSLSSGIITATDRHQIAAYQLMIQTDATINRGNSGGPMLDLNGNVVGVVDALLDPGANESTASFAGVGLAIAGFQAEKSVKDIIEHGQVRYPNVSFSFRPTTLKEAQENELKIASTIVDKVSPYDKGQGLALRDIIVGINGNKVSDVVSVIKEILHYNADDVVTISVLRNNEIVSVNYKLKEYNPNS